jgi:hypothetical protein
MKVLGVIATPAYSACANVKKAVFLILSFMSANKFDLSVSF